MDKDFAIYRTSDIYFSAYLSALDICLDRTESQDNDVGKKKIIFVFRVPRQDLNRLKASFFGGTGTVKALKICQQLRTLKQMCYV